jgi:hypothetical protein
MNAGLPFSGSCSQAKGLKYRCNRSGYRSSMQIGGVENGTRSGPPQLLKKR